jgi:hypothetical protein
MVQEKKLEFYHKALSYDSNCTLAQLKQVSVIFGAEPERASELLSAIRQEHPDSCPAHFMAGVLELRKDNKDKAQQWMLKCL